MINHYLLTLTPEAEDRILTTTLGPGHYYSAYFPTRCLVGAACDAHPSYGDLAKHPHFPNAELEVGWLPMVEERYDGLCLRFGAERTNRVIRERILANQLRRTLAPAREGVPA